MNGQGRLICFVYYMKNCEDKFSVCYMKNSGQGGQPFKNQ